MKHARPLPPVLIARHQRWMEQMPDTDRTRLADLAHEGQQPQAMIIACCDSRVMASDVFGAEAGEFFVHRNIANLVPPFQPDGQQHGTSATIEFAVTVLKVAHLIVMGHYGCGGVKGCHDMFAGEAPELTDPASFVGSWLRVLEPGYQAVAAQKLDFDDRLVALERQAVLVSLDNLMTFPFVRSAIEAGKLEIHGVWKDIRDGGLEVYDAEAERFARL